MIVNIEHDFPDQEFGGKITKDKVFPDNALLRCPKQRQQLVLSAKCMNCDALIGFLQVSESGEALADYRLICGAARFQQAETFDMTEL